MFFILLKNQTSKAQKEGKNKNSLKFANKKVKAKFIFIKKIQTFIGFAVELQFSAKSKQKSNLKPFKYIIIF